MVERRPVRFLDLLRRLKAGGVDFVVVGGVAAVLEGVPVSTFDLDIVYSTQAANVDRLLQVLRDLEATYLDPAGREILPDASRLSVGGHHLFRTSLGRLDALASIGADLAFDDLTATSKRRKIHEVEVRVLPLETLIATKEISNRPKDRAVLDLLKATLAERRAEGKE